MNIQLKRKWLVLFRMLALSGLFLFNSLTPTLVSAETATIAVASNFTQTMMQLKQQFEQHSDHRIRIALGSSGKLFSQIKHGAPFHAFFSADQQKPDLLEKTELIVPGSRFTYAIGKIALWSRQEGKDRRLKQQLLRGQFNKLALADPKLAPYGLAAVKVLERLDLKDKTREHWVLGENIAQTFQFVRTGNAEIGFVALSQVMKNGRLISGTAWVVPEDWYTPIKQDAVILLTGRDNQALREFLAFVVSEKGWEIIRLYGYLTPDTADSPRH